MRRGPQTRSTSARTSTAQKVQADVQPAAMQEAVGDDLPRRGQQLVEGIFRVDPEPERVDQRRIERQLEQVAQQVRDDEGSGGRRHRELEHGSRASIGHIASTTPLRIATIQSCRLTVGSQWLGISNALSPSLIAGPSPIRCSTVCSSETFQTCQP